jgi:hypothetical protein
MTSPKLGLLPASGDDRFALLAALELASGGVLQFGQVVGAEIGQGVPLEPGPQVFDWIEVRRVAGQQRHLYGAIRAVEVLAHDAALVLRCAVPHDHQLAPELPIQRFEEFDDLHAFYRAVVQAEQEVCTREAGDGQNVLPVEVILNDRRAA